jgi:hypothetical protein
MFASHYSYHSYMISSDQSSRVRPNGMHLVATAVAALVHPTNGGWGGPWAGSVTSTAQTGYCEFRRLQI